jgi:cell wall-associated NlpC family hydrolase
MREMLPQTSNAGRTTKFIEESEPGDLAVFDNEEGNIIHVGIIMENNYIIHASGKLESTVLTIWNLQS